MARDFPSFHEFIHDVGIFVAQEDSQLHSSRLRDSHGRRQLAIYIAAPVLGDDQQLSRTVRKRSGLPKER
jgi:hypothetical protein